MAAPTFVGVSPGVGVSGSTSTITVAAPSGMQAGDHRLVLLTVFNTGINVPTPNGWTLVGTQTNTSSGTPFKLWCFTTTSVTDAQAFSKGTSSPAVAVSIAYRGGSGVVAFAGQANASTTSHALAPVTTTTPDSVVLGVLSEGTTSSAIGHTIPDGWNGEERIDYASDSGIGRVGMIAVYDTVLTSPGTQGGTITSSTSGHSATVTLALSGVGGGSGSDPTPPTGDVVDTDDELNWVAPSVPGDYVIRYEVTSAEGTFTDDLTVTVSDVPTGPQTVYPQSVGSTAQVGEPLLTVEVPDTATLTRWGVNTVWGSMPWGYSLPTGPVPQTVTPSSVTRRAMVGQPIITVDEPQFPIDVTPSSVASRSRVGSPSLTQGAAPPDQPITDLSISLFAIDPTTGHGIPLPDFKTLELSPLRNSAGSIRVEYPRDGINFEVLRSAITEGRDVEVEIWFNGTAAGARRGYLQEAEGDDLAEGDTTWTFLGGFLGLRMDEAVIEPQDPGPLVPDGDDNPDNDKHANERRELIFNAATPGMVMATAMRQAQARGVLTDISWDFTATHDSEGNPWPNTITSRFSPLATYTQILNRLVTLGLAEWDVQWTGAHRVLRMWVPEGRGDDLTAQPIPVVLRHGQNLLDAPRKWSVREAGTDVWVAGAEGLYAEASDAQAVARRGRKIERPLSANNLADDEGVLGYAISQLPVVTSGLYEVTHGIGFLPGAPRPIVSYDIGDWVLSDSGGDLEKLRVVQWTLTVADDGTYTGTVTLNDTHTDWLVRLKARLDAIEAGETVVGTSEPKDPALDDITPPAAPEGLVATSIAYTDPAHTNPLAYVTVGWQPVTMNADGSNHPLVQAARWLIIQIDRLETFPPPEGEDPYEHGAIKDDTWTWKECPRVVTDYAPQLRSIWVSEGSPSDRRAWLQNYVDTFSATPTATDDVAGYKVRYAYIGQWQVGGLPSSDPFPEADRFYYEATPSAGIRGTSYTFGGVEAGANIRIEVCAFDRAGNHGPWASIGHDTAADDTPPERPSTPTLSVWFRTVDITWDGLDLIGVPMALDFDHVEVWLSQSSDFSTVPSTASQAKAFDPLDVNPQHVANLYAGGTWNQPDLPHGVGWFAALRAVDRAGNVSPLSGIAGPVTAEQLFPDDLRDEIINDPAKIAKLVIGTAHIADAAIVSAKIANLAVNDAHIESLNVGKLRSGTMIAQVTVSGRFRTHESDAANRVEFDAAGIRLYRGSQVVGNWNVADGSITVTGTYQSALSGERINIFPDGTLRFYPSSGTNYSQMSTVGAEVIWRGPMNSDGRSGRLNVNALGVGMNYSAESEIPNNLRAEMVVFDRRARITAPFIAFEVNGKLTPTDGSRRRVQFYETSSSGTAKPNSYVQYGTDSKGIGGMFGNGAGWKFEAGNMLVCTESLNSFGPIKASDFVEQSSREVKRNIVDVERSGLPFDPEQVFRDVPAVAFNYRDDDPSMPPRIGVIAEEMPEFLQEIGPDGKGGLVRGLSVGSRLGLLHAAMRRVIARLDALEGRQ